MNAFLFVCGMNLMRSPTAEHVARKMGHPSDSAGTDEAAVRVLTGDMIDRADRIVCMEERHRKAVVALRPDRATDIEVWAIPDKYDYGQAALIRLIKKKLAA